MYTVPLSEDDSAAFQEDAGGMSRYASDYGEMLTEGALQVLHTAGVQPGQRFYDLGAGAGKMVALAWMEGLNATGVELSHFRWDASCQAIAHLHDCHAADAPESAVGSLSYVHGSMFDLDFTDADLVFISSVMFSVRMMARIAETARWLKVGSRIVSHYALPGPEFRELGDFQAATTWKIDKVWRMQEVVENPPPTEGRPSGLKLWHEFEAAQQCNFSKTTST